MMNFEVLHKRAVEIAERFHKVEIELIDILQAIDERRVFVNYGYSSLFDYATKALKLSESNAYNFITVARKAKAVPELKAAIHQGEITVSKARKLTPVLTPDNSARWLEMAKTLPRVQLEKEIARAAPQSTSPDRV